MEMCIRDSDNTTKEFSSDNGSVYRPNYHVVCEKRITVKAGDEVRCMAGDGVRGQGAVSYTHLADDSLWTKFWKKVKTAFGGKVKPTKKLKSVDVYKRQPYSMMKLGL